MLNYTKNISDGVLAVTLEGQLDTDSAPGLEAMLLEELPALSALTMDLAKLDYISSAGLRVLLRTKKIMGTRPFAVINVSESVMDIFDVTGFTEILGIGQEN